MAEARPRCCGDEDQNSKVIATQAAVIEEFCSRLANLILSFENGGPGYFGIFDLIRMIDEKQFARSGVFFAPDIADWLSDLASELDSRDQFWLFEAAPAYNDQLDKSPGLLLAKTITAKCDPKEGFEPFYSEIDEAIKIHSTPYAPILADLCNSEHLGVMCEDNWLSGYGKENTLTCDNYKAAEAILAVASGCLGVHTFPSVYVVPEKKIRTFVSSYFSLVNSMSVADLRQAYRRLRQLEKDRIAEQDRYISPGELVRQDDEWIANLQQDYEATPDPFALEPDDSDDYDFLQKAYEEAGP